MSTLKSASAFDAVQSRINECRYGDRRNGTDGIRNFAKLTFGALEDRTGAARQRQTFQLLAAAAPF